MDVPIATDLRATLRERWGDDVLRKAVNPRVSLRPNDLDLPQKSSHSSRFDGVSSWYPEGTQAGTNERLIDHADNPVGAAPRFIIGDRLGQGGMGVVHTALQRSLGRMVAVKIAHGDLSSSQQSRFRAEARCTAWLEHPNIIPVYDAGRNYMVMRRIDGLDLESRLNRSAPGMDEIIEVLIRVCDALAFAHHRGIIHRDIKPENILLGEFGEVMVADWGLALAFSVPSDGVFRAPEIGRDAVLCAGTPGYMAPEVALSDARSIGPATDVFLLGATLYRCLSGSIPFQGEDVLTTLELSARNDWRRINPESAPRRLIAIQEQAMASNPRDRMSVRDLQSGLRSWLLSSQSEAEAMRSLRLAQERMDAASRKKVKPHEAYLDFSEAIASCDRALALSPELTDAKELRRSAMSAFALSAVGAGELELARLIRSNGTLPISGVLAAAKPDQPSENRVGQSSTVRRIGLLVPGGHETSTRALLQEMLLRKQDAERLTSEVAQLKRINDALVVEKDAELAKVMDEIERLRRRWHIRLLVMVGLVVLVCVLLILS
jgi:serine/threonine protein kinase